MGIAETKWLEADVGVRRSKMRRCESDDTADNREGE